jgi:hypothetical protein
MTQDRQPKNDQHGSPLGLARRGFSGRIKSIKVCEAAHGMMRPSSITMILQTRIDSHG